METGLLIANLLVLLVNVCVTAAGVAVIVKLWTEQLKDRKFDQRANAKGHDGGRSLNRQEAVDAIADQLTDRIMAATADRLRQQVVLGRGVDRTGAEAGKR